MNNENFSDEYVCLYVRCSCFGFSVFLAQSIAIRYGGKCRLRNSVFVKCMVGVWGLRWRRIDWHEYRFQLLPPRIAIQSDLPSRPLIEFCYLCGNLTARNTVCHVGYSNLINCILYTCIVEWNSKKKLDCNRLLRCNVLSRISNKTFNYHVFIVMV